MPEPPAESFEAPQDSDTSAQGEGSTCDYRGPASTYREATAPTPDGSAAKVLETSQPVLYILEIVDMLTGSLVNEQCAFCSRTPLAIPDVGELVAGPGSEPYRVLRRTFKYRVGSTGELESQVVLHCVNLKEEKWRDVLR